MKTTRLIPASMLALTLTVLPTLIFAQAAEAPSANKPAASGKATTKGPAKPYPLDVCIVTDNDLGSMGEETSIVYEGQTIKFCCKPCEKKFLKNPAKYLEKLAPKTK